MVAYLTLPLWKNTARIGVRLMEVASGEVTVTGRYLPTYDVAMITATSPPIWSSKLTIKTCSPS